MERQLRLMILDYPKLLLDQTVVRQAFSDLIAVRQLNYDRTSDKFVSLSSLDMVSTHILIYDQTEVYKPRLVAGLRIGYEDRARFHRLKLPIQEYLSFLQRSDREKFESYRSGRPLLVQVNNGFVDPDYSYSKTGLKLLQLTFFGGLYFAVRRGFDHWVVATNEKLKTSRWAVQTGHSDPPIKFIHPEVGDEHKLFLFNTFNYQWLSDQLIEHARLFSNRHEILPAHYPNAETLMTEEKFFQLLDSKMGGMPKAA